MTDDPDNTPKTTSKAIVRGVSFSIISALANDTPTNEHSHDDLVQLDLEIDHVDTTPGTGVIEDPLSKHVDDESLSLEFVTAEHLLYQIAATSGVPTRRIHHEQLIPFAHRLITDIKGRINLLHECHRRARHVTRKIKEKNL